MRIILSIIVMALVTQASAQVVTIWFVANVNVGVEKFVDDDGKYKFYSNRVHWVELLDTYSTDAFTSQDDCEKHLLSTYSSVWRSNGRKTVVTLRDPSYWSSDTLSDMREAKTEGFMISKDLDWHKELVKTKPFYICAQKMINLNEFK